MSARLRQKLKRYQDACIAGRMYLVLHFRDLTKAEPRDKNAISLTRECIQALEDLVALFNLLGQILDAGEKITRLLGIAAPAAETTTTPKDGEK